MAAVQLRSLLSARLPRRLPDRLPSPFLTSPHLRSAMSEEGWKRWMPRSLTGRELKRNPALIPLLVITAAGGLWAAYYLARLAIRSPEVTWRRHTNPEPWNEYENKQYKFYSTIDHSKLVSERPKY